VYRGPGRSYFFRNPKSMRENGLPMNNDLLCWYRFNVAEDALGRH
jgi:hypothetical protein